jgi:hypothetical protein
VRREEINRRRHGVFQWHTARATKLWSPRAVEPIRRGGGFLLAPAIDRVLPGPPDRGGTDHECAPWRRASEIVRPKDGPWLEHRHRLPTAGCLPTRRSRSHCPRIICSRLSRLARAKRAAPRAKGLSASLKRLNGQCQAPPFVLRVAPGPSKGLPGRASLYALARASGEAAQTSAPRPLRKPRVRVTGARSLGQAALRRRVPLISPIRASEGRSTGSESMARAR